ncbi:MAG TPA: toxin-antitoxin system YwqK family antitoxin [Bacteroidales bacterium]|nr:toxin-antitoxin system YwqK family antitoxin [Bacteroidales bacterium]
MQVPSDRFKEHLKLFSRMKIYQLLTLAFLLLLVDQASGQVLLKVENSKYFDTNHNLYTGKYIEYYENGNKRIEMTIRNGELDSTTILYFPDGKIQEIRNYKNGLMHGRWITYNAKGVKIAEANYSYEKKDGKWQIFDDEGRLRYEMYYKNGERCGVWRIYSEDGQIQSERSFPACKN